MNARSICPARYKRGVIRTYVRRAVKTCSTWELFDAEIDHIKNMLTNNNYQASDIDREIKRALDEHFEPPVGQERDRGVHTLYYKNQMSAAHKLDERVLKDIIGTNVTPTEDNRVDLRIYYRSRRTSNMIMRNNLNKTTFLKSTKVVYKFTCPHEDCQPQNTPIMLRWSHYYYLVSKTYISQTERRAREAHAGSPSEAHYPRRPGG